MGNRTRRNVRIHEALDCIIGKNSLRRAKVTEDGFMNRCGENSRGGTTDYSFLLQGSPNVVVLFRIYYKL